MAAPTTSYGAEADELVREQTRLPAVVTRLDQASRGITASVSRTTTTYTFGDDDRPSPFAAMSQNLPER